MPTLLCLVAPLCTQVLPTACRRKLPPLLPQPSKLRSLPHLRGSTLSGLEAPSFPPCQPSNRCGSPSRNTMSAAHPLSTESASKQYLFLIRLLLMFFKYFVTPIHTFRKIDYLQLTYYLLLQYRYEYLRIKYVLSYLCFAILFLTM